ncbi:ParA family protein [Burkholderia territorii]|uniref:ParA family protein n=1 Tax=Burkholderia territorii TaxID=1503055 RepID=UPI0009BD1BE5|nr:ParA family protein [Burkholderia territorii]
MKSLLVASAHGGTGKTTLVCQFAHHLRLVRRCRVLVIDLAEPASSAMSLTRGAGTHWMKGWAPNARSSRLAETNLPSIGVLAANAMAGIAYRDDPIGARCYANLRHVLRQFAPLFDVCLIDSPPWPDSRAICAAALADALVSPVLLWPDALSRIVDFINGSNSVRSVRARLNPSLRLIGLIPNCVEPTSRQQTQLKSFEASMGAWLVSPAPNPGAALLMPRLDAMSQAQADGVPVAALVDGDLAAYCAWQALSACFDGLARQLDSMGESQHESARESARESAGESMCESMCESTCDAAGEAALQPKSVEACHA